MSNPLTSAERLSVRIGGDDTRGMAYAFTEADDEGDYIFFTDFTKAISAKDGEIAKLLTFKELADDAVPILEAVLEDREAAIGEECEVLRDLISRFRDALNQGASDGQ